MRRRSARGFSPESSILYCGTVSARAPFAVESRDRRVGGGAVWVSFEQQLGAAQGREAVVQAGLFPRLRLALLGGAERAFHVREFVAREFFEDETGADAIQSQKFCQPACARQRWIVSRKSMRRLVSYR